MRNRNNFAEKNSQGGNFVRSSNGGVKVNYDLDFIQTSKNSSRRGSIQGNPRVSIDHSFVQSSDYNQLARGGRVYRANFGDENEKSDRSGLFGFDRSSERNGNNPFMKKPYSSNQDSQSASGFGNNRPTFGFGKKSTSSNQGKNMFNNTDNSSIGAGRANQGN
jgi:hypothetical protein